MTDWIEHNGGPQPVADNVWVEADDDGFTPAEALDWARKHKYIILNQHLIDAALKRGIELGLKAALAEAVIWVSFQMEERVSSAIRNLNPETIAREAALDQLTREAQTQGMGYATKADQ